MEKPNRRAFLAACGLAATAGCTAPTTTDERPTEATGGDTQATVTDEPTRQVELDENALWPTFGGNAANTGRRGESPGPSGPVTPAWRVSVDGIYTMPGPVLSDGLTFVGSGEKAYAVDALTGEPQWNVDMGSLTHYFSPSMAGDNVLFGAQSNIAVGGDAGRLSSFALDGTEDWRRDLAITSSPSVVDGAVYVGESTAETAQLRALDAADGSDRWTEPLPGSSLRGAPAVADGTVFATTTEGSEAGVVTARAIEDGGEIWSRSVEAGLQAAPVVDAGTVYVQANDGRLFALEASTGETVWTTRLGDRGATPPALTDDWLVGLVENTLVATDRASGERAWEVDIGYTLINGVSVAGERAYVGGSQLTAVDIASGEVAWEQDVPGQGGGFGAPIAVGNAVFVGVCIKEEATSPYDDFIYAYI